MRTVSRMMGFAKKYWFLILLAFLCLLATTTFSLVVPLELGHGLDTILSFGQRSAVILAAVIIVSASILRGVRNYSSRYIAEVASQRIAYDIRDKLYDHLQRLSFAFYDNSQIGQLMSRASVDVEAARRFFGLGLLNLLQTILLACGVAYFLISLNWRLALITLTFFPFIAWRAIHMSRRLAPIWLRVQQRLATLGTRLQEALTGIRVVKAFAQEKEEERKFYAEGEKLYDDHISAARQVGINMPMMVFLLALPTVLVIWYGGRQVIAGTLTIGGITQFILYLGILAMPVRHMGFVVNMLSRMVSASKRILEILDTESLVKEKPGAISLGRLKGQVAFENVSFSYNSLAPAPQPFHPSPVSRI